MVVGMAVLLVPSSPAKAIDTCIERGICQFMPLYTYNTVTKKGLCIQPKDGATAYGTPLVLGPCDSAEGRSYWYIEPTGTTGWYGVRNKKANLCMDVEGASTANSARLLIFGMDCSPSHRQFRFHDLAPSYPGQYWIVPKHSSTCCNLDKVLDVERAGAVSNVTRILQYQRVISPPAKEQRFYLY